MRILKIIILAGGSGSRLWPLSRAMYPKQFIKIFDDGQSLFQKTFLRCKRLTEIGNIFVVTNKKQKFLVMGEIEELEITFPEENIIIEPAGKNTLPAICAGIKFSEAKDDENILVLPSDHLIYKEDTFITLVKDAQGLASKGIITFGIIPDNPNTGYGYIEAGEKVKNGFKVKSFKEKPDLQLAQEYLEQGFLWNSGMFLFNTTLFLQEMKEFASDIYKAFSRHQKIELTYADIKEGVSIDYGVLEKSKRIYVLPADIDWDDLGSFDSLYKVLEKDEQGNVPGSIDNIFLDSQDNFIYSEKGKLIAVIGVNDLIVVDNQDALMICKKERAQQVREMVNILKNKKDSRTEYHTMDYRPWGKYKILLEEKNKFKVKRIYVNPGKKLSYQKHKFRSEHWVVVKGQAEVLLEDQALVLQEGESIFIPAGKKHRLANSKKEVLEIIEIQHGNYLEEDDIVRFDDEYGR